MANDSEYGLGGAVWTRDLNRALRVSRAVETGRHVDQYLQSDSRRRSFRRIQTFRHRQGDRSQHPGTLYAEEKYHDQSQRVSIRLLSGEIRKNTEKNIQK